MVALAADTRRHAVNVYGSPDGRQWVSRDDYEALRAKATFSLEECESLGGVCNVVCRLLEHATGLTPDEKVRVREWLATVGNVVERLAQ
jgi:hypothetical protein